MLSENFYSSTIAPDCKVLTVLGYAQSFGHKLSWEADVLKTLGSESVINVHTIWILSDDDQALLIERICHVEDPSWKCELSVLDVARLAKEDK